MAATKQEYQAIFVIAAKLAANFRTTMAAAQSRLKALEHSVKRLQAALKTLAGGLGGIVGIIATAGGVAGGLLLRKLFEGAADKAIEANQRTKKLTASLMQFNAIAAKGPDFAAQQTKLLRQSNELLAKQQIYQEEILDSATAQAAVMGIPPKEIARMMPAMADILAVSKGVKATQEDAAQLTTAWGKAIRTGMVRPLAQYGIILTDTQRKEFRALQNVRLRHEYLLQIAKGQRFVGQAAKLMETPEGKIFLLNQHIAEMQKRIGEHILPLQAKMAELWDRALPTIEPAIIWSIEKLGKVLDWVIGEVQGFIDAWKVQWKALGLDKDIAELNKAFHDLLDTLGIEWPEAGFFGRLIASSVIVSLKILVTELKIVLKLLNGIAKVLAYTPPGLLGKFIYKKFGLGATTSPKAAGPAGAVAAAGAPGIPAKYAGNPALAAAYMRGYGPTTAAPAATPAAATAAPDITAAAANVPAGLTKQQQKGAVLYQKLLAQFKAHPPAGVPPDAAQFGITKGTPEEWARFGVSVAHAESGFNPKSTNLSDPGGSFGVFQYAHGQAYGNAYDVDKSVAAFVRDANSAAASGNMHTSILGRRFSTIGSHPGVGARYLGQAEHIAQASAAAQPAAANAPPFYLAAARGMQFGGIVGGLTHALLGERGPEAVIPLGGGRRAMGLLDYATRALTGRGAGGTHMNFTPNITIHGGATDEQQRAMDSRLRDLARDFISQFKAAQYQERRLSYESGY